MDYPALHPPPIYPLPRLVLDFGMDALSNIDKI